LLVCVLSKTLTILLEHLDSLLDAGPVVGSTMKMTTSHSERSNQTIGNRCALLLLSVVPGTVPAREPEPARTDWFVASKYGVFVHYLVGV
jgi:hypothetical protein